MALGITLAHVVTQPTTLHPGLCNKTSEVRKHEGRHVALLDSSHRYFASQGYSLRCGFFLCAWLTCWHLSRASSETRSSLPVQGCPPKTEKKGTNTDLSTGRPEAPWQTGREHTAGPLGAPQGQMAATRTEREDYSSVQVSHIYRNTEPPGLPGRWLNSLYISIEWAGEGWDNPRAGEAVGRGTSSCLSCFSPPPRNTHHEAPHCPPPKNHQLQPGGRGTCRAWWVKAKQGLPGLGTPVSLF